MSRPGRCIRPRIREILETSSVPRIFKNIRGIPYRIEIHFLFHSEDPSNSRGRLFLIVYFSQSVALLPSLSPLFPFFFSFLDFLSPMSQDPFIRLLLSLSGRCQKTKAEKKEEKEKKGKRGSQWWKFLYLICREAFNQSSLQTTTRIPVWKPSEQL